LERDVCFITSSRSILRMCTSAIVPRLIQPAGRSLALAGKVAVFYFAANVWNGMILY
jgi:hypothetical protein